MPENWGERQAKGFISINTYKPLCTSINSVASVFKKNSSTDNKASLFKHNFLFFNTARHGGKQSYTGTFYLFLTLAIKHTV
jgi:hypothetical protein